VNQAELRQMAVERLKDAKALLGQRRWEFAYHAAGYSVECALKACVLARTTAGRG
jgi:HEPN domain-containing protein